MAKIQGSPAPVCSHLVAETAADTPRSPGQPSLCVAGITVSFHQAAVWPLLRRFKTHRLKAQLSETQFLISRKENQSDWLWTRTQTHRKSSFSDQHGESGEKQGGISSHGIFQTLSASDGGIEGSGVCTAGTRRCHFNNRCQKQKYVTEIGPEIKQIYRNSFLCCIHFLFLFITLLIKSVPIFILVLFS